jgi:hypothetical protein
MESKKMYAIYHGQFFDEGYFVTVFDLKKDAEKAIRLEGYKFNKKQKIFINYNDKMFNDSRWYRIEKIVSNSL